MVIGRGACKLQESKCHCGLQKEQERPRGLQASQPPLEPWESGRTTYTGKHFQAHESEDVLWE